MQLRNLDKSSKIIDIAQEDNLPLEVLRLDVTVHFKAFVFSF
jgi:hypothetical protein